MAKKSPARSQMIAHHLPHRTRIRLPRSHRDPATMKRMTESLSKVTSIKDVQINDRTGSMVVYHEEDTEILEHIDGALGDVAGEVLEAILQAEEIEFPGLSIIGVLISSFMGKADNKIASATNNVVDLKMLMPLAFLGAGFFQASRNAAWLSQVPAWVLFYFAYDSYTRFHGPVPGAPAAERVGTAADSEKPVQSTNRAPEKNSRKVSRVTQLS